MSEGDNSEAPLRAEGREYQQLEFTAKKHFTNCIRSHGSGITLNTFFMMAKEAGVSVTSATSANPPSVGNNNKTLNIGILNNLENDLAVGGMAEVAETPEEEEKQKTSSCGYTFSDKINIEDMDFISRKIYELHHDNIAKCDAILLGAYNIISGMMGGTNGTTSQRSWASQCGTRNVIVYNRMRTYSKV